MIEVFFGQSNQNENFIFGNWMRCTKTLGSIASNKFQVFNWANGFPQYLFWKHEKVRKNIKSSFVWFFITRIVLMILEIKKVKYWVKTNIQSCDEESDHFIQKDLEFFKISFHTQLPM